MTTTLFQHMWLSREKQFSAFTNGILLDFWNQRQEGEFTGVDGVSIRYVHWRSPSHKKALVICSGRSESYVKYPEVAFDFYHLGYDIFLLDHRGQGLSGRLLDDPQKGHVEKFSDYVDDLSTFIDTIVLPYHYQHYFALAHSMGGAILASYLLRKPDTFQAAALCAPMFGINLPIPRWVANFLVNRAEQSVSERNNYAVSTGKWFPLPFILNVLTHSHERYRRYLRYYADFPQLRLGGPTYHWMKESLETGDWLIEHAKEINTPLLVLEAELDKVVDNRGVRAFCDGYSQSRTREEKQKLPLVIEGAHHEILFEIDKLRSQALTEICEFYDKHLF
ncbi:lysophospholipase L2 [Proteus mirabilis]|uniref:lysophospholipase L2 n=1 Tax=Proteus mirabilis TaxID=584 RepID=UPI00128EDAAA|nr:lysophospholipase L2 [Proteus mirabilis]EKW9421742.1 lysophospholipase L2 [Proteus mirabilis]MBB6662971.1 lysophospholipase L2 [Proteus mirabilis]MBB6706449.1 lysophospholipase L2 [Proteus mirabilis]MBB6728555.1 lysophospholipase L2 [Proteus mirabilis]MBG2765118.1 lysophospholipase L2 [Proteus mirabilis]